MKTMRFLLVTCFAVLITAPLSVVRSQDTLRGDTSDPDVRWNVNKQYDEDGNLIYYDSSCVHSRKHFNFPGPEGVNAFENLDSLFGDFFHFPDGMFENLTLAFGPFCDFMDSLDLDFSLDSSIFQRPYGFWEFTDTAWMDSFFPDVFSDRHKEWIEQFREGFTFPGDSLYQFHPKWQDWRRQQKKSTKGIEI